MYGNGPRLFPCKTVFVHKQTHKFGYCKRGMSVVYVYSRFFGKIVKARVALEVVLDYGLKACADQKILLRKAQLFALEMVVGGIKHFAYEFRLVIAAHSREIVALGKRLHVERRGSACTPKPQYAYALSAVTAYHHVVRKRLH